jgi:hypothetical protein
MFENICTMKKIQVGVNANEMSGLQGGVKAMTMGQVDALCSPTSALKRMPSRLGEKLRYSSCRTAMNL